MNDRFGQVLAVIAAMILVGGGVRALLGEGWPIAQLRPSAKAAAPASASLPPSLPAAPAAIALPGTAGGPVIYRCDRGGKVMYSDSPCKGGRLVDMVVTEGYRPPGSTADTPPGCCAPATTAAARRRSPQHRKPTTQWSAR